MTDDDFLGLGEDDEPAPAPRRTAATRGRADAATLQALLKPVSISFLADALGLDRKTVTKRIADLPPVGHHRGNIPLYNFQQAWRHLAPPNPKAVQDYLKRAGMNDLPDNLKKDVWDARLKEQKWRAQAGELWRTEDVLDVLGEAFSRLKTTTMLWVDQLSEGHAMSAEARRDLTAMVDGLMSDLHRTLVEMPKERATLAQIGELGEGLEDEDDG